MKKPQAGSLAEKGASFTMKKGGDGSDGCKSSGSGNGNETRTGKKGAAADDPKKVGEGDAGTSSSVNSWVASLSTRVTRSAAATAAATPGASGAATTAPRTATAGDPEGDAERALVAEAAGSKDGEREEEVKDAEGGQAGPLSGGGSNRAQRTCRRLALKRIRQYVGCIEEGPSTPTAPDIWSAEERSIYKEGKNLTSTPSTASSAVRSGTSSRARRGGSAVTETGSAAAAGTRQRGRTPASSDHSNSLSKHTNRSKGDREAEDVEVASGCTSPFGGGNGNKDALSCTTPVCKSETTAVAASAAGAGDESEAGNVCTSNESESVGIELTGADDSPAHMAQSAVQDAGKDSDECTSGNRGSSSSRSPTCAFWKEEEEDVPAAAPSEGNAGITCGSSGRRSCRDAASDSGSRVREGDGPTDGAATSSVASTPKPSTAAAGTDKRPSAGGAVSVVARRSSSWLRGGNAIDADLQGHRRVAQLHQMEGGKFVVASDDATNDNERALAGGEETARCEKDTALFSSAPAAADAVMPPPAAATAPPAAATLPSNIFLSGTTVPASRAASCATGAASFPASLASPSTCGQQHTTNLNALMVKSVSPAGVVRRGGRNRRKRTKYDLAYRQMEELGPFAEEAKAVDLTKVSGSSFAVELLKNPELYSYEAWSHGFAWPVGADGRRLLLRKLRGVYWSDPDYWQQRLMSEGLYRRDLFTLATVQELFKVTHLMGPAVWDFLLKCTALTHKCEALTAKDSDQTDGEDGGGAAAHASSPDALSPNAGPRSVAPSADGGVCTRRLGSSSRGSLLPAPASDQLYAGRERHARTNSFPDESCADTAASSEAAAAAHALAAAAGAVAEDPVSFSSWLRATTAGVTSLGATEDILEPPGDADGTAAEGVLHLPHAGLACAGTPVREVEEGAVKGGGINKNFTSSSRPKKSFTRCAMPPAPPCEPESSGLQLDLSTQQMLDAVAAAVEAAAAAGHASQPHPSQATTNRSSTVDAGRAPYLATNSDIAAVLAAARGFDTSYECHASSASSASRLPGCESSKGADSLVAADTQVAATNVAAALPGVATDAGSDMSLGKAAAAFREPGDDPGTEAQRLSAAAAAAAAADWLGSLQQLLPPVMHAGVRCGGASVDEGTPETGMYDGKTAESTSTEKRTELPCSQYASLSVLDAARDVRASNVEGARMADKLLELLSSPSGDKRSTTEVPLMEAEHTGRASAQKDGEMLERGVAPRVGLDTSTSLAKTWRNQTENSETSSEAHSRAQKQQDSSGEDHEELLDKGEKKDGFTTEGKSHGGRTSFAGMLPRTNTDNGAGLRDMSTLTLSHPAFGLLLSPGEEFPVERSVGESSLNGGSAAAAERSQYNGGSAVAAGPAAAAPEKAETSGVCPVTDEGYNLSCPLSLRSMMRLMTATAATAPEVAAAAEECSGNSRAAAGIENFPEVEREASVFASQSEVTQRTSGKKSSPLVVPQQQEQQARSMSSLMTTLATALEQHTVPLDSRMGKSTESTDAVTEENARQVISLWEAVNQHFEKQQKKPVTSSCISPPFSSSVLDSSTATWSRIATALTGEGSSRQGLQARVTDSGRRQTASETLGELLSHGRQEEQTSGSSRADPSSGSRCTECAICRSDGSSRCKDFSSKGCPRRGDQPTTRKNSSSEPAALTCASTSAVSFGDGTTEADGNSGSASAYMRTGKRAGEKSSAGIVLEPSLRDTAAVLSGEMVGDVVLPKTERPDSNTAPGAGQEKHLERRAGDAVDVGGGSAIGSFSQKQMDAVPSRPSLHKPETRSCHSERQAGGAAPQTGAAAAAANPTDLWMRCIQAMGSSLAFFRNCPPRASEPPRRVGSRRNSDPVVAIGASEAGDDSARADAAPCRPTAAAGRDEDNNHRDRSLSGSTSVAEILGVRDRGRSTREGRLLSQPRRRSSEKFTEGGTEDVSNTAFPGQAGECSGALLMRALRAYSSSAGTMAETELRVEETGLRGRDEEEKVTTGEASNDNGGGVGSTNSSSGRSSIPLRGNRSFVGLPAAVSSSWQRDTVPGSDGSGNTSSAGSAAASSSAPSAASLLESTHALLQLKTHYDFMAQFMQCMMLLEVQQALVRLLQSLRRNNPSMRNSRNPSSCSVRRARRMQRRSGQKRKVSFFSSGNDSSCGSSSETGLVDKSLHNSEKFIHHRRRRWRTDAPTSRMPPDPCARLRAGEEAVSAVSACVVESENLQRTSAAVCVIGEKKDHHQESEPAAHTEKSSSAAAPVPLHTSVASREEFSDKNGGNSSSVQATSTCSSSAYSSVGGESHRQSMYRSLCQPGSDDSNAGRRKQRSPDTSAAGDEDKGLRQSRTDSTNSSKSHSISSRKCGDREENVQTYSSGCSSISGSNTHRTEGVWKNEAKHSGIHSNNRSADESGAHFDPDISLETFSERDATMKSCLESLVESLRVQMRFVHVMAGHLQEHMGAAAAQEEELEGAYVVTRVTQSPQAGSSQDREQHASVSAARRPTEDMDIPGMTSPGSSGDSQPPTEAAVGSRETAEYVSETAQKCAGRDDSCNSTSRNGKATLACSSSACADSAGVQRAFAQDASPLCEEHTLRDFSAKDHSRRISCADNFPNCRDTAGDRESRCVATEKVNTSSSKKATESDRNNGTVGSLRLKKRRLREESAGQTSMQARVEDFQVSAGKRVEEKAQQAGGTGLNAESGDKKTPTRTTEGDQAAEYLSEEAESTLPEDVATPTSGGTGPSKLRDRLARPTAAGETRYGTLQVVESGGGELLLGRSVCPAESSEDTSSALLNNQKVTASSGGRRGSESHIPTSCVESNKSSSLNCEHVQRELKILQELTTGNNASSATSNHCTSKDDTGSSDNVNKGSCGSGGSASSCFSTNPLGLKIPKGKEMNTVSDIADRVNCTGSVALVNSECREEDARAADAVEERTNSKDVWIETSCEKIASPRGREAGETATEGDKTETEEKECEDVVPTATVGAQQQQPHDGK